MEQKVWLFQYNLMQKKKFHIYFKSTPVWSFVHKWVEWVHTCTVCPLVITISVNNATLRQIYIVYCSYFKLFLHPKSI